MKGILDIKKAANTLAKKYRTRNPFEMVQGMNVILIQEPLVGIKGFYQYYKRNNLIYIDPNLPEIGQVETLAHEIGHMVLHKGINRIFMESYTGLNTSKYEIEADTFAAELLISDDVILEFQRYTIEQISRYLGYAKRLIQAKTRE